MKLTIPFIFTYVTNYPQKQSSLHKEKKKGLKCCTREQDQNYYKCIVLFSPDLQSLLLTQQTVYVFPSSLYNSQQGHGLKYT